MQPQPTTPLVSIITPSFNDANFVSEAYQAIKCQTVQDFEWIIVDDASTDKTKSIIQEVSSHDYRVRLICMENNSGAAVCRNKAIELAAGEFLAFLDMDDYWSHNKLENSLRFMREKNVAFSFHSYKKLYKESVGKEVKVPHVVSYNDLLKTCSITTSTVVIRANLAKSAKMPESLRRGQDYVYWLKLLSTKNSCAHGYNIPDTFYRVGHKSLSSNKLKKAVSQWKILAAYTNLSLGKRIYYYLFYAFHGFLKWRKK